MTSTEHKMRLIVLGATGSVGQSTLDIVLRNPERFEVVALVANSSVQKLASLAKQVKAQHAVVARPELEQELAHALDGSGITVGAGENAVLDAVDLPADMVVGAIVGAAGLKPTLRALKPGRSLALANKECLVCAGDLFMAEVARQKVTLLPVDSEHSAIFQVFEQENAAQIEKIILTASGGPFRTASIDELRQATPEQALKHPNWEMGSRITIDSATMMNKGFELIEAFHLFPVSVPQLDVLVHPQSIVHGLVQYKDGSLLAQLGSPDMRTPIAHCLAWPQRMEVPVEKLDLASLGTLTFEQPDLERFPSLALSLAALKRGGCATTVLNAADEVAVEAFLKKKIGFTDIPACVEATLDEMDRRNGFITTMDLDSVLEIDAAARQFSKEWISTRCS